MVMNPNSDENMWAQAVKNDFDFQQAKGVLMPRLHEGRIWDGQGIGGVRFEQLATLGLEVDWISEDDAILLPVEVATGVENG